jgi:ribosomal protein L31E
LTNYLDPELNQELVKKGIEKILAKTNFTPSQLVEIVKSALGK